MTRTDDPIVGIDLGTTNSVVAAIVDGRPQVLEEDGEKLLPSVVAIDTAGQLVTGVVARNQLAAFPDRTVASIKRQMGKMDAIKLGDESFTPPEISAMILRRLRDRASRALQIPVCRAVITVPAFFDESQRQATREAGELAGLQVERIINEPTAAALVYHAGSHDRKHLVIYDFGGGTFDVSVVRLEAGVVEVLSSKGDTQLGGDDMDQVLLHHVADQFQAQHQVDLRENLSTQYRLLKACEKAKMRLSVDATVQIIEEFIADKDGQPLNLCSTVTREQFAELIVPMVDRTIASVDEALRDAGLTIHQIDDLVLVGGSTRTPLVQQRLRGEFLREPSRAVDPDLAVAAGAAVQAAMIDGQSVGPVLVDVTGHTLGIEVCDRLTLAALTPVFSPIIHRNSPLPARYENAYETVHDQQEMAEVHVLQGEYADIRRNRSIGRFKLDLEPGSGDRSKVVVRFDLTLDGILNVTATQPATGISKELKIDNALSQFQADERDRAKSRLDTMFDASSELMGHDGLSIKEPSKDGDDRPLPRKIDNSASRIAVAESKFSAAVALLEKAKSLEPSVDGEDAEDIRTLMEDLKVAMSEDDATTVASLCEELDDILFYVQ